MWTYSFLLMAIALGIVRRESQGRNSADFLSVLPDAVRTVDSLSRADSPAGWGTGPLLIDVESIVDAGRRHTGDSALTAADVRRAIGMPHRSTAQSDAVLCDPGGNPCRVLEDGVFLQLKSVSRDTDRLVMQAAVSVTHPRFGGGPTLCISLLRIIFVPASGKWKREKAVVDSTC